jgi:hypothetical protein
MCAGGSEIEFPAFFAAAILAHERTASVMQSQSIEIVQAIYDFNVIIASESGAGIARFLMRMADLSTASHSTISRTA